MRKNLICVNFRLGLLPSQSPFFCHPHAHSWITYWEGSVCTQHQLLLPPPLPCRKSRKPGPPNSCEWLTEQNSSCPGKNCKSSLAGKRRGGTVGWPWAFSPFLYFLSHPLGCLLSRCGLENAARLTTCRRAPRVRESVTG